ncbi:MAG: universal stress protein [Gammaproteobacteria bacterium]
MYKHILVPSDGSKLSLKAVKTAARLARTLKAQVTVAHVMPPYMPPVYGDPIGYAPIVIDPKEYKANAERNARRVLADAAKAARAFDITCGEVMITEEHPWQAILKVARNRKCDLIVMSSHGRRGLAGFLLGSETTKVLTHSKLPVLVCR